MAGGTAPELSVGGAVVWLDITLFSWVCDTGTTLGEHTDTPPIPRRPARASH
ncbi:hypothetical protein GCM10017772_33060 [Promicromonospora soli]|uniref:Uncharacterized protein n=1 Tax=Promicromonospora soli TaxID=2035533 RepID=A0A919KWF3_9MICO|nr:hypothetical protein GCM10017772_33060 [Promicromonospora soli]